MAERSLRPVRYAISRASHGHQPRGTLRVHPYYSVHQLSDFLTISYWKTVIISIL